VKGCSQEALKAIWDQIPYNFLWEVRSGGSSWSLLFLLYPGRILGVLDTPVSPDLAQVHTLQSHHSSVIRKILLNVVKWVKDGEFVLGGS
jgi:hypothetical protein